MWIRHGEVGDMTPNSYSSSSVGVRLEDYYLGGGSEYNTSDQNQGRTGLTGTPLGVGLAIKLIIHEIAFVNIWPNQQAR